MLKCLQFCKPRINDVSCTGANLKLLFARILSGDLASALKELERRTPGIPVHDPANCLAPRRNEWVADLKAGVGGEQDEGWMR